MHRVERMEADARSGDIPSLRERFEARSGRRLADFMPAAEAEACLIEVGCSLRQAQQRLAAATLAALEDDFVRAARLLGVTEDELRSLLRP
jgi:hypothetical protein